MMDTIARPGPRSGTNKMDRIELNGVPEHPDRAHRVLAQFEQVDPAARSRRWAIALARTEGGMSFYGAGVTFFVFDDLSTLYLDGKGLRFGGKQPANFFEHPYGERVFL